MRYLEILIFKIKAMNTNLGIETFLLNGCLVTMFKNQLLFTSRFGSSSENLNSVIMKPKPKKALQVKLLITRSLNIDTKVVNSGLNFVFGAYW